MEKKASNFSRPSLIVIVVATMLLILSLSALLATETRADTLDDYRSKSASLQDQIDANEAKLNSIQAQEDTLNNKIAEFEVEIAGINDKIKLTEVKIKELKLEIEETQKELDRQKDLLRHALVTLYKEGNVSMIELLASSDSYTEFINQQEYLSRLKDQVHESANQVEQLKEQLESDKEEQDKLLEEQEVQRDNLVGKKAEQQRILEQAQGEEARYQAANEDLKAELEKVEAARVAYLASLIAGSVSLGPVSKGDVVGLLGNTGYSTGPHVHFSMYTADDTRFGVDPVSTMNQFDWSWPVSGGGSVTQPWGCSPWGAGIYPWNPSYGCYFHNAVDIAAPQGTPLLAVADGDIIHRGCLYTGTIYSTYMVIIDHGNGYYSSYAHMSAPNDPAYEACAYNTLTGERG